MDSKIHKHYLQSSEWANLREQAGWKVSSINTDEVKAHAYQRKTPFGTVTYMPGFTDINQTSVASLTKNLKANHKGLVCKLEPCVPYDSNLENVFLANGWHKSRNVQYSYTIRLDLTKSEETLLAEMKKRARWEIRTAVKKGVQVQEAEPTTENFELMYKLLSSTSQRKDFTVRDKDFVMKFWQGFASSNKLRLFFARHEKDVLAGAIIILNDDQIVAWYKDGASMPFKMDLYAPRLLVWEAARALKKQGVETFDLGGIPNPETYEDSHMKGIYIFKSAYSHETTRMMPAYELPLKPLNYKLWPKIEALYVRGYHKFHKMWY